MYVFSEASTEVGFPMTFKRTLVFIVSPHISPLYSGLPTSCPFNPLFSSFPLSLYNNIPYFPFLGRAPPPPWLLTRYLSLSLLSCCPRTCSVALCGATLLLFISWCSLPTSFSGKDTFVFFPRIIKLIYFLSVFPHRLNSVSLQNKIPSSVLLLLNMTLYICPYRYMLGGIENTRNYSYIWKQIVRRCCPGLFYIF